LEKDWEDPKRDPDKPDEQAQKSSCNKQEMNFKVTKEQNLLLHLHLGECNLYFEEIFQPHHDEKLQQHKHEKHLAHAPYRYIV